MKIQMLETLKPYLFEGATYNVVDEDTNHLVVIDAKGQHHFVSKSGGPQYKVVG